MLRRGGSKLLSQLQQLRGYAAAEAALATESPFLRFGSPFAAQLNMNDALAQLPETKVRPGRGSGCNGSGVATPATALPPLPQAQVCRA